MLKKLQNNVKQVFESSDMLKYYFHTERVYGYTIEILKMQKRTNNLLLAAALVHDIGRTSHNGFIEHIEKLNSIAEPLLKRVGYSKENIDKILKIAGSHHPSASEKLYEIDDMVLYDADNLDLVGILGFMRWFGSVPNEILEMIDSAKLYLNIYDTEVAKKGSLFYTNEAKVLGETSAVENTLLCKALVHSIERMHIDGEFNNEKYSFSPALLGKPYMGIHKKKTILLLSGYRCSGKSYLRKMLSTYFSVDVFDTNSKRTYDPDANVISPKEVIERYGKGDTYFLFLIDELAEFIDKSSKEVIVIDSVKNPKDIVFFENTYPDFQILNLWLHCPDYVRFQRYEERDVKNNIRNEDIHAHDHCLEELGIVDVMKRADFIINMNNEQSHLIMQLSAVFNSL